MKIYIAQTNPKNADITYNLAIIKQHIDQARAKKATIVVFGELAITGYALKDLFLNATIIEQTAKAIEELEVYCPEIAVVIGYPKKDSLSDKLLNTAGVFYQGKLMLEYYKKALVDFECFNESRYFTTKTNCQNTFSIQDHTFALSICHDIWDKKTMPEISSTKVDGIINISASPYEIDKDSTRDLVLIKAAKQHNCKVIYTNIVGGHDGLIFDGNSKIINQNGNKLLQLKHCQTDSIVFDLTSTAIIPVAKLLKLDSMYKALTLGVSEYIKNNSLKKICIGISGGLDSAVVAALAVDAIGAENVVGIFMPSRYTSQLSIDAANQLAKNLSIQLITQPITSCFETLQLQLSNAPPAPQKVEQQNLQARLRCCILMYYANMLNAVALNTGNKSELAMGYCTTYGDMIGALAPIGDLFKTKVFELAKFLNTQQERIPAAIIQRPPSAELAPNQKDTDQLLAYDLLDSILTKILQANCIDSLNAEEKAIYHKLKNAEHKRRQSPFVIKLTNTSFNIDRQQPITYKPL